MAQYNEEFKKNGITATKVNHDVNGNPRYVVHFLAFTNENDETEAKEFAKKHNRFCHIPTLYNTAAKKAHDSIGGSKYRAKWFGGGIVFQSYNIMDSLDKIFAAKNK